MAEADVSRTPTSLDHKSGMALWRSQSVDFGTSGYGLGAKPGLAQHLTGRTRPITRLVPTPRSRLPGAEAKGSFHSVICRSSHLSGLKRQSLTAGGMSRAGYSPANVTALALPSYNPSMAKSSIRMGQEQVSELGTRVIDAPSTGGIITFESHTDFMVSSWKNSIRE
jgi:hypothetical protein